MNRRIGLGHLGFLAAFGCADDASQGVTPASADRLEAREPAPSTHTDPSTAARTETPRSDHGSELLATVSDENSSSASLVESSGLPASFTKPICRMEELLDIANSVVELFRGAARQYHQAEIELKTDAITGKGATALLPTIDDSSARTWLISVHAGSVPTGDVDCNAQTLPLTRDIAEMLICHELGHFFAGFPFKPILPPQVMLEKGTYPSAEGQADYFATKTCLRQVWLGQSSNKLYKALLAPEEQARAKPCETIWHDEASQDLCYRSLVVSQQMLRWCGLDVKLSEQSSEVRDTTVTGGYPGAQCRLDSAVAGALCQPSRNDLEVIPGLNLPELSSFDPRKYSVEAETAAKPWSCYDEQGAAPNPGTRPRCWFAPYQAPPLPDIYDCSAYVDGQCKSRQEDAVWIDELVACDTKTGPYVVHRCELGCVVDAEFGFANCAEGQATDAGMCVPRADGTVHLVRWSGDRAVDSVCAGSCDYDADSRVTCTPITP